MRTGRPKSAVTREAIEHEIFTNKLTIGAIAEKFGVSRDTIERRLRPERVEKANAKKKASRDHKKTESPKPEKEVSAREAKIHLLSRYAGDISEQRYIYNEKTDTYVNFLKTAPEPVVVSGPDHRAMAKAYSDWDGEPASINKICRTFNFPRPWFIEYKRIHGWTHDREPFSAEEMITRPVGEMVDEALQDRRQALYKEYETAKWAETEKEADMWRNFNHSVLKPLAESIAVHVPKYKVPLLSFPRVLPAERFSLVISPTDLHFGKAKAWEDDAGQTYSKTEVEDLLMLHAGRIINQVMRHGRPECIFIPFGSDWFHVDNLTGSTTALTPQDCDRLPENIMFEGKLLAVKFIDLMRQLAPVVLVPCKGNHDEQNTLSLMHFLHAWYRNSEDVTVQVSNQPRQYIQYGNSLMGVSHGHNEKVAQLPGLMANEARSAWAECSFFYSFTGHFHHRASEDIDGVEHFQLPSLAGPDRWHIKKGFRNSRRAIHAHKITFDRGVDGIFISTVVEKNPAKPVTFGFKLHRTA